MQRAGLVYGVTEVTGSVKMAATNVTHKQDSISIFFISPLS